MIAQVQQHFAGMKSCPQCDNASRTKGHYQPTLRPVSGNVGMRIRRLSACSCSESSPRNEAVSGLIERIAQLESERGSVIEQFKPVTAKRDDTIPERRERCSRGRKWGMMTLTEEEKTVAWKAFIRMDDVDIAESIYAAVLAVIAARINQPADGDAAEPALKPTLLSEVEWLEAHVR